MGGVLFISIATFVIVILIGCKIVRKSPKERSEPKPVPQEALYDEIQDGLYDEIREDTEFYRYKNSPQREHVALSSNPAYTVGSTLEEGKDEMEDNSTYGEVSIAMNKEEAANDESEEYTPMAPLAMQALNSNEMNNSLRHV